MQLLVDVQLLPKNLFLMLSDFPCGACDDLPGAESLILKDVASETGYIHNYDLRRLFHSSLSKIAPVMTPKASYSTWCVCSSNMLILVPQRFRDRATSLKPKRIVEVQGVIDHCCPPASDDVVLLVTAILDEKGVWINHVLSLSGRRLSRRRSFQTVKGLRNEWGRIPYLLS